MDDVERDIASRAIAIVPGCLAAKRRGDRAGLAMLQQDFIDYVAERGKPHCFALSALYVATLKIADAALDALAQERGKTHQDEVTELSLNLARSGFGV